MEDLRLLLTKKQLLRGKKTTERNETSNQPSTEYSQILREQKEPNIFQLRDQHQHEKEMLPFKVYSSGKIMILLRIFFMYVWGDAHTFLSNFETATGTQKLEKTQEIHQTGQRNTINFFRNGFLCYLYTEGLHRDLIITIFFPEMFRFELQSRHFMWSFYSTTQETVDTREQSLWRRGRQDGNHKHVVIALALYI